MRSGGCGRVKRGFYRSFQGSKLLGFVIFIVGTWSFYNIFDQQLFSCLFMQVYSNHTMGNAPVWLSQLIPGGTRSAMHGDYSFLCESGRAKNALLIGVVDYGVAYPFLRAVR